MPILKLGALAKLRESLGRASFILTHESPLKPVDIGGLIADLKNYADINALDVSKIMKSCEEQLMNTQETPVAAAVPRLKANVMLDLETLGTKPGCKVMSIGAVAFGPDGVSGGNFCVDIHRDQPLAEQADTIKWWEGVRKDNPKAYDRIFGDTVKRTQLPEALASFAAWLSQFGGDVLVWGNGADFDNPILSAAYVAAGVQQPWGPWSGRCYRTLKGAVPGHKMQRVGTHHNALDDATSQADHAVRMLNAINGWEAGKPPASAVR